VILVVLGGTLALTVLRDTLEPPGTSTTCAQTVGAARTFWVGSILTAAAQISAEAIQDRNGGYEVSLYRIQPLVETGSVYALVCSLQAPAGELPSASLQTSVWGELGPPGSAPMLLRKG